MRIISNELYAKLIKELRKNESVDTFAALIMAEEIEPAQDVAEPAPKTKKETKK